MPDDAVPDDVLAPEDAADDGRAVVGGRVALCVPRPAAAAAAAAGLAAGNGEDPDAGLDAAGARELGVERAGGVVSPGTLGSIRVAAFAVAAASSAAPAPWRVPGDCVREAADEPAAPPAEPDPGRPFDDPPPDAPEDVDDPLAEPGPGADDLTVGRSASVFPVLAPVRSVGPVSTTGRDTCSD